MSGRQNVSRNGPGTRKRVDFLLEVELDWVSMVGQHRKPIWSPPVVLDFGRGNAYIDTLNDRGVEQLVARRAHNPKVAGSREDLHELEKADGLEVTAVTVSAPCFSAISR